MEHCGQLLAVCVVHTERDSGVPRTPRTAIDKRPLEGPVPVTDSGVGADYVCDVAHHGGTYKAVYAYSDEESRRWADELGRELPIGWFGENLHVRGIPTSDAVIGERWRIGDVELEVTSPRTPCATFANWAGEPQWVKRFTARGDTGVYLRVIHPGTISAGDTITRAHIPEHGVTVREVFSGTTVERLNLLVDATRPGTGSELAPSTARNIEKYLKRAGQVPPPHVLDQAAR
ncbi:MAG: MOSC domain-containing protein [Rhodococcus sp.]|nr:MOSC domain-containing protein [Rhodococcus sp. (in: high G+C Gram-positive bacteria)]